MKTYVVVREKNQATTNVKAESRQEAALRGAIKLGIRYSRVRGGIRKPTLVTMVRGDKSYWHTYCYDEALNACANIYEPVIVSEPNLS